MSQADDEDDPLGVVDSSNLTDADWAEINRLRRVHRDGGQAALSDAMRKLGEADPRRYVTILAAFFPEAVREAIKGTMAEQGLTEEDMSALVRKVESPAGKQ